MNNNNTVRFVGDVFSPLEFSHELYGESFYEFNIKLLRRSGALDIIPVIISERLLSEGLSVGDKVIVEGEFRSHNIDGEDGKSHLKLFAFAQEFTVVDECDEDWYENEIRLRGFLCKEPIYRETPLGRKITDILLAINRNCNRSDYIPAIAWSRNALYVRELVVGMELQVKVIVQSRTYTKQEGNQILYKTAIEVSINALERIN